MEYIFSCRMCTCIYVYICSVRGWKMYTCIYMYVCVFHIASLYISCTRLRGLGAMCIFCVRLREILYRVYIYIYMCIDIYIYIFYRMYTCICVCVLVLCRVYGSLLVAYGLCISLSIYVIVCVLVCLHLHMNLSAYTSICQYMLEGLSVWVYMHA